VETSVAAAHTDRILSSAVCDVQKQPSILYQVSSTTDKHFSTRKRQQNTHW